MTNQEILEIMSSKLLAFERGEVPLHQIVRDLYGLHSSIDSNNILWINQLKDQIFALEEINAIRLDEEYSGTDDYDVIVSKAVVKIRFLIKSFAEIAK